MSDWRQRRRTERLNLIHRDLTSELGPQETLLDGAPAAINRSRQDFVGWSAEAVMTQRRLVIVRRRSRGLTSNSRLRFDIPWSTVRAMSTWSDYVLELVHEPAFTAHPEQPIRKTKVALLTSGNWGGPNPQRMIALAQSLVPADVLKVPAPLERAEPWEFPMGPEFYLRPEPPRDFLQDAIDSIMGRKPKN